jgi:hypothetical protein
MPDYLLLMHDDIPASAARDADWGTYLARLEAAGTLQGGSEIGPGVCVRKSGETPEITAHLAGFIRITAVSMDDARAWLAGNPVYEAGGTVEIRELPQTSPD